MSLTFLAAKYSVNQFLISKLYHMNFDYYTYIVLLFVFFKCNTGKPTAAICHGAWMFCSAKILKGKKLTCFVAIKDDVENAG